MLDVARIREDFPVLSRTVHGRPLVYLDNAATSQKPRAMIERITQIYAHDYARAEEGHTLSREATKAFEGTRAKAARLINAAEPREIVFCRGATEALNIVTRIVQHMGIGADDEILLSQAEHHSNIVPWLLVCRETGARLRVVPMPADGDLDLTGFEAMLTERVRMLAITYVSNVTGAIFPIKHMTQLAHARGIPVLVDGAQATPHMPVDVRDIGCDYYAGSGHKMGGPSSVGFLYGIASRLEQAPAADGGSTMSESVTFESFEAKPPPHKFEAGEPAFGEVEAWGPAIDYWMNLGLDRIEAYEKDLTAYAVERLRSVRRVRVLGDPQERISVVSFVVEGQDPNETEQALDECGIATRAGKLASQPQLQAFGVEKAVRASFLFYNTREEVNVLAAALAEIAAEV
jgi:cysteine desulfurase/selenocysteine lyase